MKCLKRILAGLVSAVLVFSMGAKLVSNTVLAYNSGIEAFVNSLYSDCLGRSADPTGFNDWCNKLATGKISGKQAAYGFFFSPEFQAKANAWSDTELINAYYKVFLNRGSDPSGASYWAQQIAGTTNDISILFTGFADSTEFANKCASYGITVGSHVDVPTTVRGTAGGSSGSTTPTGGASGLAAQTNGIRANSPEELDAYWTSQGFEIFYIDLGYGNTQKCYARFYDMTEHNNQVNAWRNQNGLPSLAVISDPNDIRYQYAKRRAIEVAYSFAHVRPMEIPYRANGIFLSDSERGIPSGEASENIFGGNAYESMSDRGGRGAFEAFRLSPLHNVAMLLPDTTSMVTASCQVAFVQPDGVSTYYDSNRGGFYSPSTGYAEGTVQLFYY